MTKDALLLCLYSAVAATCIMSWPKSHDAGWMWLCGWASAQAFDHGMNLIDKALRR